MKKIISLIMCIPLLFLSACDVHEWPETPKFVKCHLQLNYETNMTEWIHLYDDAKVIEQGYGETYDSRRDYGKIRYVVRTYPMSETMRTALDYTQEFVFTKDISEGYDHVATLDLLPGNYNVMVWSELVKSDEDTNFYNSENFANIMLQGNHKGNNDYRDAFYGQDHIMLTTDIASQPNKTITITMKRPLAKFAIVSNDLLDFLKLKGGDLSKYNAKIQYVGFMPNVYSLFTNRPVASTTGVMFESTLTKLSDSVVSIGFDYVFASDNGSTVTVRIGIYDNNDKLVSLSNPITIPIKPDHNTLLMGKFLMMDASNGVDIDPNWGGDYNIIL